MPTLRDYNLKMGHKSNTFKMKSFGKTNSSKDNENFEWKSLKHSNFWYDSGKLENSETKITDKSNNKQTTKQRQQLKLLRKWRDSQEKNKPPVAELTSKILTL